MGWETLTDLLKARPVFHDLPPFARTLHNLGVMAGVEPFHHGNSSHDKPISSVLVDEQRAVSELDSSGELPDPHFSTFEQHNPPSRRGSKDVPGGPRDLPAVQHCQQHDPARSIPRRESVRTGRREHPGRLVPMEIEYSSGSSRSVRAYRVSEEEYRGLLFEREREIKALRQQVDGHLDDKAKLSQQVFELGGVEEGATDQALKEIYEAATGQATSQLRKVFGKPVGDEDVRLGALLEDGQKELLRFYGNGQYHNVMSCVLYAITAKAVDQRYCVGAIPALEALLEGTSSTTGSTLSNLKMLEDVLRKSPEMNPRALNAWRSSFMKVLLRLPKVEVNEFGGGNSLNPEISDIFDSIWSEISAHVPRESKSAQKAISKLIKLRIELSQKIRTSLATYEFEEYKTGTPFDSHTMSIADVADDWEAGHLDYLINKRRERVVVGFCIFPALVKWGNEQGYDLDVQHVVRRATVLPLCEDDEFIRISVAS